MCLVILGENLLELRINLVAVGLTRLYRHLDSTVWHKCTLQRLIRL